MSIHYTNTSTRLWGEDAGEFKPEPWPYQSGIPEKAQEPRDTVTCTHF